VKKLRFKKIKSLFIQSDKKEEDEKRNKKSVELDFMGAWFDSSGNIDLRNYQKPYLIW
jgi:hypothetical protein